MRVTGVNSTPEKFMVTMANKPRFQNFFNRMRTDEDFFQKVLLGCTILQHELNTFWYVLGDLTNSGMPPKQRTFAASIDLAGMPLNLASMVILGTAINKYSGKWAEKSFKFLKKNPRHYELAKLGFRSFLTVFVSGTFALRIVSPYFQGPLAKWIDDKYFKGFREKRMESYERMLSAQKANK